MITIGPDGRHYQDQSPGEPAYDGSDDTYVAVINQANSGVAVLSLQLTDAE